MVREVTFKLYKFDELDDKVKEKVLEDYRCVLVEDYDWVEGVLNYAESAGLEVYEFDINRGYVKLKFEKGMTVLSSIKEICRNFDKEEEIYKLAKEYYDEIVKYFKEDEEIQEFMQAQKCHITILDMKIDEFIEYYPDSMLEDIARYWLVDDRYRDAYLRDMGNLFLSILEDEFNCLVSDDAIIEHFNINNYEFFENGKVFNLSEFVLNNN